MKKNTYKIFIYQGESTEVISWLTQVWGELKFIEIVSFNDEPHNKYYTSDNSVVYMAYSSGDEDNPDPMISLTIETQYAHWLDHKACADAAYENMHRPVMCDSGFPEMFFMWYSRNEEGAGLIDPMSPDY